MLLDRLPLLAKGLIAIALAALAGLGAAVFVQQDIGAIGGTAQELAAQRLPAALAAAEVQRGVLDAVADVQRAVGATARGEVMTSALYTVERRLDAAAAAAGKIAAMPALAETTRELDAQLATMKSVLQEMVPLTEAAKFEPLSVLAATQFDPAAGGALALIGQALDTASDGLEAQAGDLQVRLSAIQVSLLALIGGGGLVAALLGAALLQMGVARPIAAVAAAADRLAQDDAGAPVPGTGRRDEIGPIARALEALRQALLARAEAEAAIAAAEAAAEAQRTAALRAMAAQVESESGQAVAQVAEQMGQMSDDADAMASAAERVARDSRVVSGAAEQAQHNIGMVASATEQLGASIREIAQQITGATDATRRAAESADLGRARIGTLAEEVERIGGVARIIAGIAAQTNLLALNATIEAARAGEAGKGFAVVAGEVKQLAAQTAKATDEITRQVQEISAATEGAVAVVRQMADAVGDVDHAAAAIAAAMEQQSAATQEIARAVGETAAAANEVSTSIGVVAEQTATVGGRADGVKAGAAGAREAVAALRETVVRVVRQSTPEVDRRLSPRVAAALSVRLGGGGLEGSQARLQDISEGGCSLALVAPTLIEGQRLTLHIDTAQGGLSLPAEVVAAAPDKGRARLRFAGIDGATQGRLTEALARMERQQAA